jgi:hypothetical protein
MQHQDDYNGTTPSCRIAQQELPQSQLYDSTAQVCPHHLSINLVFTLHQRLQVVTQDSQYPLHDVSHILIPQHHALLQCGSAEEQRETDRTGVQIITCRSR